MSAWTAATLGILMRMAGKPGKRFLAVTITVAAAMALAFWGMSVGAGTRPDRENAVTIYDFRSVSIAGIDTPLANFTGKVLLIVNVASACGFTP